VRAVKLPVPKLERPNGGPPHPFGTSREARTPAPRKYSASRSGCCMEPWGQNQISLTGFDVNRTLRIAALDVAVGRIGFERVVAETTGRPALAT
jgi:hypothetical protein